MTRAHSALQHALDPANPARRYSQGRLALALGVSQPAVSGWASGKTRPETHHMRRAIERLLGIPADDWMTPEERDTANGTGDAAVREFSAACAATPKAPASAARIVDPDALPPTGTK